MKKVIRTILILIIITLLIVIFLVVRNRESNVLDDMVEKIEDMDVGVMRNKFVLLDNIGVQVKEGDSLINALKAEGFELIDVSYDGKNYIDEFDYFLLQKENKIFVYYKVTSDVFEIEDFDIPEDWNISARRSATGVSDFLISMVLLNESELDVPKIIEQKTYFLDAENNELKVANFSPIANDQCFIYDSLNERFLQWYCSKSVGSVAPVIVRNYDGEIITGKVSGDEYFSREMKDGQPVQIEVKGIRGDLLVASELDKVNGYWAVRMSYDVGSDSLIVD